MEDSAELQFGSPKKFQTIAYRTNFTYRPASDKPRMRYDQLLLARGLCHKLVYGSPVHLR